MPDLVVPPITPPAPFDPNVIKDAIVDAFKDVKKGLATTPTVSPPAPPDPSLAARDAKDRADAATKEINDLAATGDAAGAMAVMVRHLQAEAQRNQVPFDTTPEFKNHAESVRRIARAENKEAFDKWGAEITTEVAKLSPRDRLDPVAYERVIRDVRANHLDELIAADRERVTKEARDKVMEELRGSGAPLPPVARGSRGTRDKDEVATATRGLTAKQRGAADSLGVAHDTYAARMLELDHNTEPMMPLVDPGLPKPGRF